MSERESIDVARSTARRRAKADEPTQERAPTVEAERAERQSRDRREDHTRATNSCYVIEAVQSDRVKANEEVTQERAADEWRASHRRQLRQGSNSTYKSPTTTDKI